MVSPSWPRARETPADAAVPAAMAVNVTAFTAAARRATVVAAVAAIGVAGVGASAAARGVPAEGAPVAAVVGYDHCRGACPRACLADLVRGLHLQHRFCRCPHGQRPARWLRRSSALNLTETSSPEQAQLPGLSNQGLLALHTDDSRLGNRKSGYPIQYV